MYQELKTWIFNLQFPTDEVVKKNKKFVRNLIPCLSMLIKLSLVFPIKDHLSCESF